MKFSKAQYNEMDLIIGDMLRLADGVSKQVIARFRTNLHHQENVTNLSNMKAPKLLKCAEYLNIKTMLSNKKKIYSNKLKLSDRIVREIKSYLPATCQKCEQDYRIDFDNRAQPSLRCFLCLRGAHEQCITNDELVMHTNPLGTVWLCYKCYNDNRPFEEKLILESPRKHITVTTAVTKTTEGPVTPLHDRGDRNTPIPLNNDIIDHSDEIRNDVGIDSDRVDSDGIGSDDEIPIDDDDYVILMMMTYLIMT